MSRFQISMLERPSLKEKKKKPHIKSVKSFPDSYLGSQADEALSVRSTAMGAVEFSSSYPSPKWS
jgi:hypothetical protein